MPSEPAAWADLGIFALRHNNPDQARTALEKARDLAPKNGQILTLMGLLETQQGHFGDAVGDYKQAVQYDPSDLRARYALEEALDQQAGPDGDPEALKQLQAIYEAAPDNLFAEFKLAGALAKAGQADLLRPVVAKIAAHAADWSPELRQDLKAAQAAVAGPDTRAAVAPLLGLQNELAPLPQYQQDADRIQGDPNVPGTPIERFLVLPNPTATPAATRYRPEVHAPAARRARRRAVELGADGDADAGRPAHGRGRERAAAPDRDDGPAVPRRAEG